MSELRSSKVLTKLSMTYLILDLSRNTHYNSTVAQRKSTRDWGGVRERAGRKRIVQDPERIAVDLERPDLDAMRSLAKKRGTSVAELIRRAVSAYLKRSKRG